MKFSKELINKWLPSPQAVLNRGTAQECDTQAWVAYGCGEISEKDVPYFAANLIHALEPGHLLCNQNLLRKTRCYTVGTMQYADGRAWREIVTARFSNMGITTFDPYHKPFINEIKEDEAARAALKVQMENGEFDKVADRMRKVRSDDLRLCDVSDFAFVNIIPKVASWGSAEELVTFVRMKKPIFVVVEGGVKNTPLWIMGMLPYKYFYNTVEEALGMIEAIDKGLVETDSERWRLLKHEYR
jgi:hypothetical protein